MDPRLEVAEIHRRVIAAGGPALLFTNVKGADFRLVTNLFGTARRAELAFGERPLRLIKRIVELAETLMPPTPAKLWGARDVGRELLRVGMRRASSGRCPKASCARRAVPNRLVTSGKSAPRTLVNSSAGPPAAITRRCISATSRCGSTGVSTTTRSPSPRSRRRKLRKSR